VDLFKERKTNVFKEFISRKQHSSYGVNPEHTLTDYEIYVHRKKRKKPPARAMYKSEAKVGKQSMMMRLKEVSNVK